jgi:hypothetical protein
MQCPKCRLINPDSAARCDCGYDFATGTVKESYLVADFRARHPDPAAWLRECARRDLKMGALCLIAGTTVILGSFALGMLSHSRGAAGVIVFSPFAYGFIMLARGIRSARLARRIGA